MAEEAATRTSRWRAVTPLIAPRAPPTRPRPRLLGQPRPRLRRDGGGDGAAPGAGGGGERRVLLRRGRAGGLERARQPDRAGFREPAAGGRDRLPAAQRGAAGAGAG